MGTETLNTLRAEIADVLEDIEGTSGGDYRLAMVTPDEDEVHVRLSFSAANRNDFESVLAGNISAGGGLSPESTDECLNTVVNALAASGRINTESCTKSPPQTGDFTPAFRGNARKFTVLITDDVPGGFCDDFDPLVDPPRAHQFALQAKGQCIKINAIQVALLNGTFRSDATTVIQDYAQTSCGWFSQLPHAGTGIGQAIRNMLHTVGACNRP